MTTPIPLLKLPSPALVFLLKGIHPKNLIDLTMLSSKFKRTLELHNLYIDFFHVTFGAHHAGISIGYEEYSIMKFEAYYPKDPFNGTEWIIRRVDGEDVMSLAKHVRDERHFKAMNHTDRAKEQLLEKLCSHLLSILKVGNFRLSCKREMSDFSKMFIWKFTRNLEFLQIAPNVGDRIRVSPEELQYLLEEVTSQKLHIKVYCPQANYSTPIRSQIIHCDDSSWVDFKNLSIHSETIYAEFKIDQEIKESDINRFVREWVNGESGEKLEKLQFRWGTRDTGDITKRERANYEKMDFRKMLEGLNHEKTCFRLGNIIGRNINTMTEDSRDIRRKTDDRLGTIVPDRDYTNIILVTWSEKYLQAAESGRRYNEWKEGYKRPL